MLSPITIPISIPWASQTPQWVPQQQAPTQPQPKPSRAATPAIVSIVSATIIPWPRVSIPTTSVGISPPCVSATTKEPSWWPTKSASYPPYPTTTKPCCKYEAQVDEKHPPYSKESSRWQDHPTKPGQQPLLDNRKEHAWNVLKEFLIARQFNQ